MRHRLAQLLKQNRLRDLRVKTAVGIALSVTVGAVLINVRRDQVPRDCDARHETPAQRVHVLCRHLPYPPSLLLRLLLQLRSDSGRRRSGRGHRHGRGGLCRRTQRVLQEPRKLRRATHPHKVPPKLQVVRVEILRLTLLAVLGNARGQPPRRARHRFQEVVRAQGQGRAVRVDTRCRQQHVQCLPRLLEVALRLRLRLRRGDLSPLRRRRSVGDCAHGICVTKRKNKQHPHGCALAMSILFLVLVVPSLS